MTDATPNANESETRRERLFASARSASVPLATILATVGVIVGVYAIGQLLFHLKGILLTLVVGSFVAMLLNPIVHWLMRHGLRRRGYAVSVVMVVALVAFAGLAVAFGYPLVNGLTNLANALPGYVRQAEAGHGWLGHLFRQYHVQHWITHNTDKLTNFAKGLSRPALALGRGAITTTFMLVTMFFYIVLVLVEAPKLHTGFMTLLSERNRPRAERLGAVIARASLGYLLGGFLTSLLGAIVIFITLVALGVPYPVLFALWVLLVDFLPQIGGALAGFPTVLFAAIYSPSAGLITLVVFLAYTLIQNHVLNPIVMAKTVNVNPLMIFLSIIVGAEIGAWIGGLFGGFVGVVLAVPFAAAIHATVKEFWESTHPGS